MFFSCELSFEKHLVVGVCIGASLGKKWWKAEHQQSVRSHCTKVHGACACFHGSRTWGRRTSRAICLSPARGPDLLRGAPDSRESSSHEKSSRLERLSSPGLGESVQSTAASPSEASLLERNTLASCTRRGRYPPVSVYGCLPAFPRSLYPLQVYLIAGTGEILPGAGFRAYLRRDLSIWPRGSSVKAAVGERRVKFFFWHAA